MRCPRCHNFAVPEVFVDYESDVESMSFLGYRCVICGDIHDATILRHRAVRRAPIFHATRHRRPPLCLERKGLVKNGDDR
jgi:RNase P subunit RPR2